jgi:DNA-binding NtrC family response regulator
MGAMKPMTCLVLHDRPEFLTILAQKLGEGYEFRPSGCEVFRRSEAMSQCDVVIVCISHPGSADHQSCLTDLEKTVLNVGSVPVVAFIPTPDSTVAREIIARGAYDYYSETQSLDELRIVLRRASKCRELMQQLRQYQSPVTQSSDFDSYLGTDPKLISVKQFAQRVSKTEANILLTGETGTGKELMARSIHKASARASHPFIAVACSSLPESLIEAELFGHEKGAFTGATSTRKGRFEAAERGTIFLDEIGELSPALQVKLLRVLQERTFERLGSNQQRAMEARVICATNRDLRIMSRNGSFRTDLYYRVNTVEIQLPALRERKNDVVPLATTFIEMFASQQQRPARRLSSSAACALRRYAWPGNVRELQHVIERAVLLCDFPEIQIEHLPPEILTDVDGVSLGQQPVDPGGGSLEDEVRLFKKELIERALRGSGDNKVRAARVLRISRSSLHRLIDELDIELKPGWLDRQAS